jgi:hypothetical protein
MILAVTARLLGRRNVSEKSGSNVHVASRAIRRIPTRFLAMSQKASIDFEENLF